MTQYTAIVGTQRSGTTVLRSVLGTHPKVTSFGEVFLPRHVDLEECFYYFRNKKQQDDPEWEPDPTVLLREFLEYLANRAGTPHVVFDCKYQFIREPLLPGSAPLHVLLHQEGVRMIHLVRENVLATYVSGLLSGRTKVWATEHPEEIPDRTVEVPVGDLVEKLTGRLNEINGFRQILEPYAPLTLTYEYLFVGGRVPQDTLEAIASHLGVENEFVATPDYKKIGLPLHMAIRNYPSVREALMNTAHALYLRE